MRTWWKPALGAFLTVAFGTTAVIAVTPASQDQPEVTLTVLAGSELVDVLDNEQLMDDLHDQTGVTLRPTYRGTLEGADEIVSGFEYDLAWFSSDHYLRLLLEDRGLPDPPESEAVMRSPVVLGVKQSVARDLGWTSATRVTWSDIADAAAAGELRFAMTNPASSNSGFSALVGVAAAFDPTDGPLQSEDVDRAKLSNLFSGQTATAGSSAYVTERFIDQQDQLDGIINYESELLTLNENTTLPDGLELIYPADGAVYADYPLNLLDPNRQDAYARVIEWLHTPGTQDRLTRDTKRRPAVEGVAPDTSIPDRRPSALPLPADLGTADQLIFSYLDEFRRPARTHYVLDMSTSMAGQRIRDLQRAFESLTGNEDSITGQFARFRKDERITILPYAGKVATPRDFLARDPVRRPQELDSLRTFVRGLPLSQGTAVYDGLDTAYRRARAETVANEGYVTSIVLMTDGESNAGLTLADFRAKFQQDGYDQLRVPTFVVMFGEDQAAWAAVEETAVLTGGELFDATATSLRDAFQEIRGYQ